MYHIVGTGLITIILYLISYSFYLNGFYTLQFHRRLWNFLLASVFIITAAAGLLLALQITYKWNIPIIKTILKWHVEIGIGLALTGFFHFFWHFSYFFRRQNNKRESPPPPTPINTLQTISKNIYLNLFIIGFISTAVQLLLLKEIMNITGGYELIAGTFLCSWLIGSAAGSGLAPRSVLSDLRKINFYFSLSPLVSIIMLLLLAGLFLKPGETPSFFAGIILTSIILVPFCFISGFTFVKLILAGKTLNISPGISFSLETAGGIVAGIIVSLLSTGILNTYQSLLLIIILGISYTLLNFYDFSKVHRIVFKTSIFIISSLMIISSPDTFFRQVLLRGIKVTSTFDTPYGNVTIGQYLNDTSVYYNQRLLVFGNDAIESEEDIHYAMLQTDNPQDIMLISGPINSRLSELYKYDIRKVVYVERDPALAQMGNASNTELSSLLQIENADAFSFVRNTRERFDAVLMLLPPPSSLLLNRYYTIEFFKSVKDKMNIGGVFSCSPGINPNYFNIESVRLYSSVFNSLKSVFRNVVPIAGNKIYFLASDKDLSTSICKLTKEKKITNTYVGPDYLSDDLITSKSEEINSLFDRNIRYNKSDNPIASFYYQSFKLSKNLNEKIPAIVLLIVLFFLSFKTLKRRNAVMYFSSLALAGCEIILLLVLQITIGNMYQITGLILAVLMAGLAIGSGITLKLLESHPVKLRVILLIVLYILAGVTVGKIVSVNSKFLTAVFIVLSGFLPAFLTGGIFRELTSGGTLNHDPADVYSADLGGSSIGFIIFSGFSVPLVGISLSVFFLPLLVLTGFIITLISKKV